MGAQLGGAAVVGYGIRRRQGLGINSVGFNSPL